MEKDSLVEIQKINVFVDAQHENGFVFKGHSHDSWEINILLKGEMEITYEEHIITLKENSIILFEPNVFHSSRVLSKSNTRHLALHFSSASIPIIKKPRIYTVNSYLSGLTELIEQECVQNEYFFEYFNHNINSVAKTLLEIFLTKLQKLQPQDFDFTYSRDIIIFETAMKYMKNNTHKTLTLDELSEICHVSESKLKRIFYKYTKTGIIHTFNNLKLKKAIQYLNEDKNIITISELLGFSSQSYFSSWFKNLTNTSPLKYKKQINKY